MHAMIINGDLSYASGFLAVWDFFLNMLAPVASKVLLLTTIGNHEMNLYIPPAAAAAPATAPAPAPTPLSLLSDSDGWANNDSGGECGLSVRLLPMPAPATIAAPWWSYDLGLAHFIGLSTEHDFTIGTAHMC